MVRHRLRGPQTTCAGRLVGRPADEPTELHPVTGRAGLGTRATALVAVEQAGQQRRPVRVDRGQRRHHRRDGDPAHVVVADVERRERGERAVAPRHGRVVLEALGRGHAVLVRHPRRRDDVAVAVGRDRLDRRRADVEADRQLGHGDARQRREHVVVQQAVGGDRAAAVGARDAVEIGEAAAGRFDDDHRRREVPERQALRLHRDVDRAVGHQHVRPEVAETPRAPTPPLEREDRVAAPDGFEVIGASYARCASSMRATFDTATGSPSRNAPSPRAAHQREPSAGADTTPTCEAAVALERDERGPHRDAAGVALGAVDRVDDPAALRVAGRAELLADDGVARASAGEALAHHLLHRAVGLGDRREIGLGVDHEVGGAKARQRDVVGGVGELEGEREIGVDAGGM